MKGGGSAGTRNDRGSAGTRNDRGSAGTRNDRGSAGTRNDRGSAGTRNNSGRRRVREGSWNANRCNTTWSSSAPARPVWRGRRSEEHRSELQSLMRISYAVLCLKKQTEHRRIYSPYSHTHTR